MLLLHTREQMKKRKLGSQNPKYLPAEDIKKEQVKRVFIRETKGVKIYSIFKK